MKQLIPDTEKRNLLQEFKEWNKQTKKKSTTIGEDWNTPLSVINRTSIQKISIDIESLNYTII